MKQFAKENLKNAILSKRFAALDNRHRNVCCVTTLSESGWGTCGRREHLIWPASDCVTQARAQHRVRTKLHSKQVPG